MFDLLGEYGLGQWEVHQLTRKWMKFALRFLKYKKSKIKRWRVTNR
jgi:hypothetical protein